MRVVAYGEEEVFAYHKKDDRGNRIAIVVDKNIETHDCKQRAYKKVSNSEK